MNVSAMLIVAQMAYARRFSLLDPSDPFMSLCCQNIVNIGRR
jgi:hypothetical protein